eukprot:CAMPEP_0178963376 /NCGR_PEP_ID=MMETSP0789-20121207/14981_1 /TAXON_ID=3005 /ORGANISM="Rhizosolenia setigera, Strain CCMP 1694" /LENGTH=193 /DNA_ID=CAMNT_0020647821 /DNA_START=895 /DNA_END=1476 /DNA_ORIENTATION=-
MSPRSAGKAQAKLYAKNRRRREIELEMFSSTTKKNTKTTSISSILPDGSIIRPLIPEDAPLVNSWWEYGSAKSLSLVRRRIEIDPIGICFGISSKTDGLNDVEELVACIMRYEGGAIGMLHVRESHRRRGYALALLKYVTQILQDQGEERVAFIVDGNTASESLFTAAGWERADPNQKRGTGKRKAKRKWIHV